MNAIIDTTEKGPRSIPKIKFIEDVEAFLRNIKIETAVAALHEFHSKYQYMESSLVAHKKSLTSKLGDIRDALQSVDFLLKKREDDSKTPLKTHFVLSDNVYAKASVTPPDFVFLWLGANTLLEYTLDEAKALLQKNEINAKSTIENLQESVKFLRCQLTTTEVNIARIHNYGVTLRRRDASTTPVVASN